MLHLVALLRECECVFISPHCQTGAGFRQRVWRNPVSMTTGPPDCSSWSTAVHWPFLHTHTHTYTHTHIFKWSRQIQKEKDLTTSNISHIKSFSDGSHIYTSKPFHHWYKYYYCCIYQRGIESGRSLEHCPSLAPSSPENTEPYPYWSGRITHR